MAPGPLAFLNSLLLCACLSAGCAPLLDPSTGAGAALASNRFGFDLYARMNAGDPNLICSPLSAAVALAMASGGARGETQAQMTRVLHIDNDKLAAAHTSFAGLIAGLNGRDGVALQVSDRLWAQEGLPVRTEYLALLRDRYKAPLATVDFSGAPEAARAAINRWGAAETHDRIKEALPEGAVNPLTRLVLINAVYFKGQWESPFAPYGTQDADFAAPTGKVTTKMMSNLGTFGYVREGDVQLLELPYGGGLSMVVVLPDAARGLPEVEARSGGSYAGWLAALSPAYVDVKLPRWTATSSLSLRETLGPMGMPLAFAGAADFSGMVGGEALHISDVLQQAFIEVNEQGTEAAAVTVLGNVKESYGGDVGRPPIPFHADHPFLYFIRDRKTDAILFIGRVVAPRAS